MKISIRLVGDRSLLKRMKFIGGLFQSQELFTVLQDSLNRMIFIAGRLAPKGDSRLLAQVYGSVKNFGTSSVQLEMKSPARYARYVEFKTDPHIIAPRRRKVMFWVNYSTPKNPLFVGGKEIGAAFTFMPRPVLHPGTKEQPFMRPAIARVQPLMIRAVKRVIQNKMRTA